MKIAIPTNNGKLCQHFGHCEVFTFIEVDEDSNQIISKEDITPPPHEPGVLPPWVKEHGANIVLAGGMGGHAQELFEQSGVKVLVGCPIDEPEIIVKSYLDNNLITGINACNH
jgi:predicted Fe-Mo cluster-binding NifX family protein